MQSYPLNEGGIPRLIDVERMAEWMKIFWDKADDVRRNTKSGIAVTIKRSLSIYQLIQVLLDFLKPEANTKSRNLSRLRGIAKISADTEGSNTQADYVSYLTEKYQ